MSKVVDLATRRSPAPMLEKGKVPPRRRPNSELRSREHLTPTEVEALIAAAKAGRHGQRDACLIMIMFRHGYRVSEAVSLRWESVELQQGLLHVSRLKNGTSSTHPLRGPELRALRALLAADSGSPYVFCSERKGPMTASNVRKIVARAGRQAKIPFPVHPHMLRHALGYKLAAEGIDTRAIQLYLGHRSITHTARYTALAPGRFKHFFND
jgi:type 1 fimbriae regulatory protein FimB/type 1 fimbriae regulatory protein FimE